MTSVPDTNEKNEAIVKPVIALTFVHLIINITRRFAYPFLPAISRQLGVPIASVQSVMSFQSGIGAISPLFGTLSERYGRKRIMLSALMLMLLALIPGIFISQFAVFALVMMGLGLGKILFHPTMQAFIGDRVPYEQRGLAMGFSELSWAGALIVASPLAGWVLGAYNIQTLFAIFTALLFFGFILLWWILPNDAPEPDQTSELITPLDGLRLLWGRTVAMGALLYSFCLVIANEIFFINYGIWMEQSFQLELVEIGALTLVIAAAEIVGEVAVMGLSDRIGKRRLTLIGASLAGIMYFILPFTSVDLTFALIGLFVMFVGVEIGIVASLPLFTEVAPDARNVFMATNAGFHSIGRLIGGLMGGWLLLLTGNFFIIGTVSLIIGLFAVFFLWRYVPIYG